MNPASRFKRFLAYVVDIILVSIFFSILLTATVFYFIFFNNIDMEILKPYIKLTVPIALLIMSLYFAILESSKNQASFGKKLFNLYVCDSNNQKLSFLRALSRYFLLIIPSMPTCVIYISSSSTIDYISKVQNYYLMPIGLLVSAIYFIPIFFTKGRRTAYDILTSSRVCSYGKSSKN